MKATREKKVPNQNGQLFDKKFSYSSNGVEWNGDRFHRTNARKIHTNNVIQLPNNDHRLEYKM